MIEMRDQLNKLLSQKNELIAEMKYDEQYISGLELSTAQNKENLETIKNEYYKLQEDKNLALKNIEIKVLKENFTILTTNLRTSNNIFETINFDIVIMDEAGAIDLPSAAIVLTRSSKVVFLGDHKQLPPIIQENSLEVRTFLRRNPKIKRSIFEVLYKNYYQKDRLILLENQYRMKKEIADFISTQFYGGRIKNPSEIHGILKNTNDKILSLEYPVILLQRNFKTEYKGGKSAYNLYEIRFIKNIIAKFEQEYGKEIRNNISIVTPYRAQLEHLNDELLDVDCGTVHTYQGQEKEIVIFSTVKYKKGINGFGQLFDGEKGENLLNVAMSRAREKFIMIGGYALFQNVKVYNELYRYVENNGLIIKEQVPGYDEIILNECLMCGEKIKFNQIRCPDCEQLHKMQTFLEEKPPEWKCIDGDRVRSNDETLIDNWLNHNNIKHQVEMKIPIQQLRYCDWYIPDYDIYIEFWGDVHTKYPEARKVKEKYKLKLKGMVVENIGKTTTLAE
jgi:superfamily I DNA and/or RNA helicase